MKASEEMEETKQENYDFDDLLVAKVGTFGRRQMLLCLLLVISNGCLAFHSLGPVFIAATPDHWCAVDKGNFRNCTGVNIKEITIPKEERDGKTVYSQCMMYALNTSTVVSSQYCLSNESETTWNTSKFSQTTRCNKWEYATDYFAKTIVNQV